MTAENRQKEIPAHEWAMQALQRMGQAITPLSATLELTERCNLRCVHCYINRPAADEQARQAELTTREWQRIFDETAQTSILWLLMTGGEPLLRPDFRELYVYAKRKGFHITLFTNGTLLTPEIADWLADYPPWKVEITLYGATAETYERVTGIPGAYARCRRGIDLLMERGITLELKTMALTLNLHELEAIRQIAREYDVPFRYDPVVHSRLDSDARPLSYRITPEQIVALEQEDTERLIAWEEYCAQPRLQPTPEYLILCGAASRTCHVDAYGRLYPCIAGRWLHYDLRRGSLHEALGEFLPAVRRLPVTHNPTCWNCELRLLCQNCPAWAAHEMGDPEAPEPFQCKLAHLRHEVLGLSPRVQAESRV